MRLSRKRLTLGLIIDWISGSGDFDYYQTKIISGVADYAKTKDINIICFVVGRLGSPYEWERSRNLLFNFINKNHIDGLIIAPTAIGIYETEEKILSMLESLKDIPIISLTESYGKYHSVVINNYLGMRKLVDHVIKKHNCNRLAFIGGPKNVKESSERFKAFFDSLVEHNIPYYPELVFEGNFLYESGNEAVRYFIENNLCFDALICANDNMAIGAITEYHNLLGKLPEHLHITGFDNSDISKLHSLTTVHQSFYEQAKVSADMLYRLLQGQEVELVQELPAELIVRSSCGCISDSASSAFTDIQLFEGDYTDELFKITKIKILSELKYVNETSCLSADSADYKQLLKYENLIIDGFYQDLSGKKQKEFLSNCNSFVFWAISKNLEITFLQKVLLCMRKILLSNLVSRDVLLIVENMFQSVIVILCDAIQRTDASYSYLSFAQGEALESLSEDLMANLDWKTQMDSLYKVLPEHNIKNAYIAIYENSNKPLDKSRLLLAFNEHQRIEIDDKGMLFNTLDILPSNLMADLHKERFNIIIMALHQGETPLGFGVFSFEDKVNRIYEIVRHNIGVALNGALLVENIKKQAADLERQVEERTREISETNKKLLNEIVKRKETETQLKKALSELELYNIQLSTESLRDELTGLYNRRGFMKLAKEYFSYAKDNNKEFLLMFGDLDGLKQINDRFGHSEGDYAIKKTAEILSTTFNTNKDNIIARLSGDEFTVIAAGASVKDEEYLRNVIQYHCKIFSSISDKPYKLSISLGFSYFSPRENIQFEDLLREADDALYEEKRRRSVQG